MVNGYIRAVFDRLPSIRSNIVRNDDNWQEGSSHNLLPLSKNGLKETRYLIMKLRKELDIMDKKSC